MLNKVFRENYLYPSLHTFSLMRANLQWKFEPAGVQAYAKNQGDSPFESFFLSHMSTLTRAEKLSNRTESPYPRTQRTLVLKFYSIQYLWNLGNFKK